MSGLSDGVTTPREPVSVSSDTRRPAQARTPFQANTLETENAVSNHKSLTAPSSSPSLQLRANACHHGKRRVEQSECQSQVIFFKTHNILS